MGNTNAFFQLTIGNSPPKQTKVVNHSTSPEWKEGFTWAFDIPPKGQKLHIVCKSKNTFGKLGPQRHLLVWQHVVHMQ
ncbi:protein CELLULOSE SYNTHASE INTERACTIVE 3-like [Cicer arietinum]|uniref:protein CELLULOSE SYNTHASE INTERACTIVE 3-like n=1 Tax=Cicer arietinum TaxID=3827 RepID=UPI003CC6341B